MVISLGSRAFAADLSVTSGNTLNVTGATAAAVLPQTSATGASAEHDWLSGLHVSGFLSQHFGMWQNPGALRDYTPSRNSLATSRTLLQVDENYSSTRTTISSPVNGSFTSRRIVQQPEQSSVECRKPEPFELRPLHERLLQQLPVRDAWWENKTGPLTTYTGNQIVVWGQSLAFRVGDVVNPADTCWAFGFANLEQSRIPQWMVHPILNLPQAGPFQSNFLEGIWQPGCGAVELLARSADDPMTASISAMGERAATRLPCLPSAQPWAERAFRHSLHHPATLRPVGTTGQRSDCRGSGSASDLVVQFSLPETTSREPIRCLKLGKIASIAISGLARTTTPIHRSATGST